MLLADTHVHLLAGLDDGPENQDVAIAMCRRLVAEGASHATALAHQNEGYPENTPDRLIASAAVLATTLLVKKIPLTVYPTGEVMLSATTAADWKAGKLLSVANRGQWLLVEMPHDEFVDVLPIMEELKPLGMRLIIAHAERYPELLHDRAMAEQWIAAGCLIQVTARTIAEPWDDEMAKGIAAWATGGFIHVIGSDGHGIERRLPLLAEGYRRLAKLVGRTAAKRIGVEWGTAILRGDPIAVPPPHPPRRSWFTRLLGG